MYIGFRCLIYVMILRLDCPVNLDFNKAYVSGHPTANKH